jgi:hypothetical protein
MITRLPGWTFEADDAHVRLRPRDALDDAWVQYIERLQPVAPVEELVRRHCQAARLKVRTVGALETALTEEGENAAVVTLDCADGQRTLGFVLLDDFYSETVGVARAPELRERVRDAVKRLVARDTHMLAGRRRPYPYDGPAGWERRQRGTREMDLWLSPAEDGAAILVAAAWPTGGCHVGDVARFLLARNPSGFRVLRRVGPEAVTTRTGLGGKIWRRFGRRGGVEWTKVIAILNSGGHAYMLQLDTSVAAGAANEDAFRAVVDSVRPLPLAPRALAQRAWALGHWIE